ncbi:PA2169 family four-helix-bundle protein [Pinirhizobacter sp.]|jgi:uncharacterized protein (TIGR02284 family)|uniref:PA2169 family four-helix-bundle protein n=1 Tax=Pinirhizobacter sp. TaxID=2950432 RepID=UPI002F3F6CDE
MDRTVIRSLSQLLRRASDDRELYLKAASMVSEPGLRAVFTEIAAALAATVGELRREIETRGGTVPADVSLAGRQRARMAAWRMRLAGNADNAGIALLERAENRLLRHFEAAAENDPSLAALASRLLPRLRAVHLDMATLVHGLRG